MAWSTTRRLPPSWPGPSSDVAVARDEDDRHIDSIRSDTLLQVETVEIRKNNVKDKTTRGEDAWTGRNSCADANVSGCQPSQRISSSSNSRTEMSSSTTNTIGVSCYMSDDPDQRSTLLAGSIIFLDAPGGKYIAHDLLPLKGRVERTEKSRVAERLEQAFHGTLLEHARTDGLICVSGNEDDRNLLRPKRQFLLQIRSGHARHGDVEDQTSGLADALGRRNSSADEKPAPQSQIPSASRAATRARIRRHRRLTPVSA